MITRIFTDAPLAEPPVRYKIRTPETWEKARADYCAGMPAPAVCARYDIGLSALRQRARAEGWRRVDIADPEPLDPDAPPPDPEKLAELAWARAGQAVDRGRVLEARRWTWLAEDLRRRAADARMTALHEQFHRARRAVADAADAVAGTEDEEA